LVAAALVALSLMTVFAIELSNTQAKSRQDVKARVHERAVLAAALIDSLFQSVQQQIPAEARTYGSRTVSAATMDKNNKQSAFTAVLDSSGALLAHSRGFTAEAQTNLSHSAAVGLVRTGHPYGLGNLLPYRKTGAIDFAVAFPTPFGERTLVTGFAPRALETFIARELGKIPGVKGAHNYLVDGNDAVLASSNPAIPAGYRFRAPSELAALARPSGDVAGHYYDQVRLSNATWRIVLAAPDGPLFAPVSGLRKWVPWVIFLAFALVAILALVLGRRVLRSAGQVRAANARLALVNGELAESNEMLERRARELTRSNADLDQFASIASHDLQEPLRKVRTFTQQLTVNEADRLSEKGRDYLQRTNNAAERMQRLIEDLLRFSRVATHGRPFAPVDLGQVTREVLEDLDAQVDRSGAVVHVGELPTITADALQMRQLMQNLLSNALKFHHEGVAPEIWIDATVSDENARVTVRDNGIGFDPQYSLRIFRVFERLHGRNEYPGTGIGLALCRKIAERHSGAVAADGDPGGGATFTVILPMVQDERLGAGFQDPDRASVPESEGARAAA
jgi:signal transduction histidine kinase